MSNEAKKQEKEEVYRTPLGVLADLYDQSQQIRIETGERIRAILQGRDETWGFDSNGTQDLATTEITQMLKEIAKGDDPGPVPILSRTYRLHWGEEQALRKDMMSQLQEHPAWPWLLKVKGIGPTLAAKLLAQLDPTKAPYASSYWSLAGLGTVPGNKYSCSECGLERSWPVRYKVSGKHQVLYRGPTEDAPPAKTCKGTLELVAGPDDGIRVAQPRPARGEKSPYSNRLKKVCWLVGGSFVKSGGRYCDHYRKVKERLERERPGWSKGRIDTSAKRITVKLFLCFSPDTEIMTAHGPRLVTEIEEGDVLATLDPRSSELEYQPATAVHAYDYHGDMVRFRSEGFDFLVTPNHRMWACSRTGPWHFVEARHFADRTSPRAELAAAVVSSESAGPGIPSWTIQAWQTGQKPWVVNPPNWSFKTDAGWQGTDNESITDDWLTFLGWWIAEGSRTKSSKYPGGYDIRITQKDRSVLERLAEVSTRLGYRPSIHDNCTTPQLAISSKALYERLTSSGKGSATKQVPMEIKRLPAERLQILFDAMLAGDGTVRADGSYGRYATVSDQLRNDVMEIGLKLGRGVRSRTVPRDSPHHHPLHVITLRTHRTAPRICQPVTREPYSGAVHCVTVPNHLVLAGRNGRFAWTGNSHLWQVHRTELEMETPDPWAIAHAGHTGKIEPWEMAED